MGQLFSQIDQTPTGIKTHWPIGLLGAAWVACTVLINPIGDFPLNDDWSYGLPVEVLLKERVLKFTDNQAASLLAQLFWGGLFCLPQGFSFTALRLSTLTLGLVGIVGMYFLLRNLGADRRIATFGAALLAFNPFYLYLSYTFMTDIPFLALMIVSMLLLIRGLDLDLNDQIVAGVVLAVLAAFIRQIGLMILVGFLVAYPLRRGFDKRWVLLALVPTVLTAVLLSLFERYLKHIGQLPGPFDSKTEAVKMVLRDIVHMHFGALRSPLRGMVLLLMYVGQWCLPYSLLVLPVALERQTLRERRNTLVAVVGLTAVVTALLTFVDWLMPMTPNQLIDFGMGIRSLGGEVPKAPRVVWIGVTALSALGASLSVLILAVLGRELWFHRVTAVAPGNWPWHAVFLLTTGVFSFGPMAFSYALLHDRHLLVFLPLLLGLLVVLGAGQSTWPGSWCSWTAVLLLAVYMGFSIAATHDYMGWNRVRWAAATYLHETRGLPPAEIDAGYEFNNLFYARERLRTGWIHRMGDLGLVDRSACRGRVAFQPLPDYEVLGLINCRPWLPWGVPRVYMLMMFR